MSQVELIAIHHIIRGEKAGGEVLPGARFKESAAEAELLLAAGAAQRVAVTEAAPAVAPTAKAPAKKGGKVVPEIDLNDEEGDI